MNWDRENAFLRDKLAASRIGNHIWLELNVLLSTSHTQTSAGGFKELEWLSRLQEQVCLATTFIFRNMYPFYPHPFRFVIHIHFDLGVVYRRCTPRPFSIEYDGLSSKVQMVVPFPKLSKTSGHSVFMKVVCGDEDCLSRRLLGAKG